MHVPPTDKPPIQSRERSSDPREGTSLETDETRGRSVVTEGTSGRRRTIIDMQNAEITKLKTWGDRYRRRYGAAKLQVAELEDDIKDITKIYKETTESQAQRIQVLEDELAQTKELLAARTTELSGAQSFLSTTDRISEAEVLGIVRDLNENIFQVAANLTEEWEKYRPGRSSRFEIFNKDVEALSQAFGPALVHHVLDRSPTAVNFLVQSRLCDYAALVSSSWRYKSKTLISVYDRLSASGKHRSHAASEMRLMHNRGTSDLSQMEVFDPQPPPRTVIGPRFDHSFDF